MTDIQTVAGPVDSSELGRTLVHEHIFVLGEEYRQNYQDDWDEEEKVEQAVRDLNELKSLGIDTIIDPTVLGLGRYIPRVQRIAARTNLNIVVATGLYTFSDLPHQFLSRGPGLLIDIEEPLTELFVKDLTKGVGDTGVRAAILKCAIDAQGLTPGVERTMRAVGQASVETGAPITVHTHAGSESGLVAQRVLAEEGVDLSRVVIGHAGDSTDPDYLCRLADAGSMLGLDRFGLDAFLPLQQRIDTLVGLVRRGYGESIVVSHDASCFIDFVSEKERPQLGEKWNYRLISTEVIPALLEAGVADRTIETILVDNPRRFLAGART
ncbi:phosphotriesterase-related protein [Actinomadura sp. 7K507]|uniref:phosphotriesterase family protein n=1 Tax=Actinomadura sp. 7K507 TaxID=2530365 RepID=UPI0010517EFC|nr:phosphotriesterase-related protein [Actinomadura sp. 7K507]TDC93071.1 phosphotriesterase-related protein [Actinomadura sp. 7K507]